MTYPNQSPYARFARKSRDPVGEAWAGFGPYRRDPLHIGIRVVGFVALLLAVPLVVHLVLKAGA